MTSQPTNAHKCMKVYNTHHISPTCFDHSCGHFLGCALKRMDKSKYFISFILCNAPPCRWPHEWPKHVQGIQHVWCTFIYLCAFAGFATISNCLVHSYGLFKLSPLYFHCTCISHSIIKNAFTKYAGVDLSAVQSISRPWVSIAILKLKKIPKSIPTL